VFPQCFTYLESDDAKFEISRHIQLQSLRLIYSHNVVTKSIAVIFVNTYIGGPTDQTTFLGTQWRDLKEAFYNGSVNIEDFWGFLSDKEKTDLVELMRAELDIELDFQIKVGVPYDKASEKGEAYRKLFADVLHFDRVAVHTNPSKTKIIEILDSLQIEADNFERNKSDKDILTVAIANVGYCLSPATV